MSTSDHFDSKITISLHRDEAVVLYWYLTRELWQRGEAGLRPTFEHPAESHSFNALLQEMVTCLMDTGGPDADRIHEAAREHLMNRFR